MPIQLISCTRSVRLSPQSEIHGGSPDTQLSPCTVHQSLRKYQRRSKFTMFCFVCCLILTVLGIVGLVVNLNQTSSVSTLRSSSPNPDAVYSLVFSGVAALLFLIARGHNKKKAAQMEETIAAEQREVEKAPQTAAQPASRPVSEKAPPRDADVIHYIETSLGYLRVYEEYCIITAKKNAMNLLVTNRFFNGEKKYYYSDLTTVQFREPGGITDCYIEFEYPGSRSGSNGGAYNSENTFQFASDLTAQMREVYNFIDNRIREIKNAQRAPAAPAVSPMDELKKLKELLDMGVITQDEFDSKKKQLLGL